MSHALADRIAVIWQELSQPYGWQLVPNPLSIISLAAAHHAVSAASTDPQIQKVLIGLYSERLYQGLREEEEQAVQDLLTACRQYVRSLKLSLSDEQLDDLAYETVRSIIQQLPRIPTPKTLLGYVFLSLRREAMRAQADARQEIVEAEFAVSPFGGLEASDRLAERVEQRLFNEQLVAQLGRVLPDPLQRLVIVRTILLDDPPREVARELGMPLAHMAVAKSRALKRLREDPEFMALCRMLVSESQDAPDSPPESH